MSTENPKTIEIKQKIQSIVSKLMSNTESKLEDEENTLIEQISKYQVSNNLEDLSKAFGNVLGDPNPGS